MKTNFILNRIKRAEKEKYKMLSHKTEIDREELRIRFQNEVNMLRNKFEIAYGIQAEKYKNIIFWIIYWMILLIETEIWRAQRVLNKIEIFHKSKFRPNYRLNYFFLLFEFPLLHFINDPVQSLFNENLSYRHQATLCMLFYSFFLLATHKF